MKPSKPLSLAPSSWNFFSRIFLGILSHLFSMNLSFQVSYISNVKRFSFDSLLLLPWVMWTFLKRFPSQVNKSDRTVSFSIKGGRVLWGLLAKEWVGCTYPLLSHRLMISQVPTPATISACLVRSFHLLFLSFFFLQPFGYKTLL